MLDTLLLGVSGAASITAALLLPSHDTVGDIINVSWRMEADWLKEPYKGADAYVKDGMMQAQVTTFDPAGMKRK